MLHVLSVLADWFAQTVDRSMPRRDNIELRGYLASTMHPVVERDTQYPVTGGDMMVYTTENMNIRKKSMQRVFNRL